MEAVLMPSLLSLISGSTTKMKKNRPIINTPQSAIMIRQTLADFFLKNRPSIYIYFPSFFFLRYILRCTYNQSIYLFNGAHFPLTKSKAISFYGKRNTEDP